MKKRKRKGIVLSMILIVAVSVGVLALFQVAKRKEIQERRKGAEQYAIKALAGTGGRGAVSTTWWNMCGDVDEVQVVFSLDTTSSPVVIMRKDKNTKDYKTLKIEERTTK